jgi:predicted  nucleic acid-binding Zn-ribbon protein
LRGESAARTEADRLRSRIEELAEEMARAEEQVSRLASRVRAVASPESAGNIRSRSYRAFVENKVEKRITAYA